MQIETHFENINNIIISHLKNAKKNIKIAVSYFFSNSLYQELLEISKNDIDVQIIINKNSFGSQDYNNIENKHIPHKSPNTKIFMYERKNDYDKMHNKYCIIDNEIVITGSYNWSNQAEKNEENIVILKENDSTNNFLLNFEKIKIKTIDMAGKNYHNTSTIPNIIGKLQPQALDFEESVLGALMLEKDAIILVIDFLRPESFYKPAHQEIYRAIFELFANSQHIDFKTVVNQLRKNGKIDLVILTLKLLLINCVKMAKLTSSVGQIM